MSPRKPAVLRGGDGQDLRGHLIATAARLVADRGGAGLAVRDIAAEAGVADGALYNYFEDKDDLLAHALLAHVGGVMADSPRLLPPAGTGTVAGNLQVFIDGGLAVLAAVMPAFAGLRSQPGVLSRFHAMAGGDAAFGAAAPAPSGSAGHAPEGAAGAGQEAAGEGAAGEGAGGAGQEAAGEGAAGKDAKDDGAGGRGLPDLLRAYLRAEQRLGRVAAGADIGAATTLIVGAIHGEILPRILFQPPGGPVVTPPGFARRLSGTILGGIAPLPDGA